MSREICRFCTKYRPDERYRGVVGWCEEKNTPTDLTNTCDKFKEGKQRWMCGEEVEESNEQ